LGITVLRNFTNYDAEFGTICRQKTGALDIDRRNATAGQVTLSGINGRTTLARAFADPCD